MYFNAETQAEILRRLHFALRPDGVLFLGKAEMLLGHASLFRTLEVKRRFFVKVPVEPRGQRLGVLRAGVAAADTEETRRASPACGSAALMSSASAQIVLDRGGSLVLSNNGAATCSGSHARPGPAHPGPRGLLPADRAAHATRAGGRRATGGVAARRGLEPLPAEPVSLDIQVVPLQRPVGQPARHHGHLQRRHPLPALQQELEYANRELETAYEELQSTNEELETTNEELQSTVEELETTNEELQSTNEELETMNEELQSMNDELHVEQRGACASSRSRSTG